VILTWLALFAAAALIILLLTAFVNVLTFPRLARLPRASASAVRPLKAGGGGMFRVSILIPARNEAAVIADTVQAVLSQAVRGQGPATLEVILLDDHSTDGTGDLALGAAGGDPRLRVIGGEALPPGWSGKNWACHQLAQAATGEVLIFADADVRWGAGAVVALVDLLVRSHADLLTVWPTQITQTWPERLVVPLMMMVIAGYLPLPMVHYALFPIFAAANGQCLCFRRAAYERIGGHASVPNQIVEDVALARRIKAHGLRLRMAEGGGVIGCRMYQGWAQVRDGFAKNILAGHGDSVPFLLISTVFHWVCFVFPAAWLAVGWLAPTPEYPLWPGLLVTMGVGLRALSAAFSRQRVIDALWLPASVLLMTVIAAQAVWWRWRYGGPRWKDRVIVLDRANRASE
jgi:chlorobactene glucosyltransferase